MVKLMYPIPTLIWYYFICKREVWLMARQMEPYQGNPFIEIGRLISQEAYQRDKKEIKIDNMVIDVLKSNDGEVIVGEVKKSSHFEKAAKMQLAYYLLRLKRLGIFAKGSLMFPKEKKRIEVILSEDLEKQLLDAENDIKNIILQDKPPKVEKIKYCRNCGYQEFCWS